MMLTAIGQTQTNEFRGGVLALLISLALGHWYLNSRGQRRTLPFIAVLGWTAQLSAVVYTYYLATAKDYALYHGLAAAFAADPIVRTTTNLKWGTEGIAFILSLIYRITGTSMLLGYVAFAAIGLIGKLLVSHTLLMNRDVLGKAAETGAVILVLMPSLNLWLAATSKESLAVLGIGIVIFGLPRPGSPLRTLTVASGLMTVAIVRPHVSLILASAVVAFVAASVALPRRQGGKGVLPLATTSALLIAFLLVAATFLGTGANVRDLEERRLEVAATTQSSDSNVTPSPIRSPRDIPQAVANVLLRPFPWEASNFRTAAQAAETAFLLTGLTWVLIRRRRRAMHVPTGPLSLRLTAIRLFGIVYTSGFLFVYSTTYNLGLVSRQRAQLWLPLVLLLATSLTRVGGSHRARSRKTRQYSHDLVNSD
jgi:hypothetical protein